jgi:hypothetical protein
MSSLTGLLFLPALALNRGGLELPSFVTLHFPTIISHQNHHRPSTSILITSISSNVVMSMVIAFRATAADRQARERLASLPIAVVRLFIKFPESL